MNWPCIHPCQPIRSERGVVSILFALLLPLLLGFGAFAVDYPFLLVARSEMQTVADAAAMAGARYLGEGGVPNWDIAIAQAQTALNRNLVAGKSITQASIQVGYWDTSSNRVGLQLLPMSPAKTDVPAISVAISRSPGQNGGEINTVFANFFGANSLPVSVTAVSARSGPSTMGTNVVFPLIFSQCMYNQYWNSASTPPGPKLDTNGQPFKFQIGSKTDTGCTASGTKFPTGAWAATSSGDLTSSKLESLVGSRLTQSLSIGDQIFANTGTFSQQLYTAVNKCSAAAATANQTCRYVTVGVVQDGAATGVNSLVGFACIEILSAQGGSSKYVEASMSAQCPTQPSSGIGPNYGISGPPKLFM